MTPVSKLLPPSGRERAEVRTWEALGDGMLDGAILVRLEQTQRPTEQQSQKWIDRQIGKVHAGLAAMSRGLGDKPWSNGNAYTLTDVAVGCTLAYLDFRFAHIQWRDSYPNLARLYEKLAARPYPYRLRPWSSSALLNRSSLMDMQAVQTFLTTTAIDVGIKILAAIAFWIVGRWIIGRVISVMQSLMQSNKLDVTLTKYLGSIVSVLLNIALVLGILGYFGVQTTSLATMLAVAGLAVGAAWSGMLGNFAAGAFMLVLKPFKVGDLVGVGRYHGHGSRAWAVRHDHHHAR